MTKANNRHAVCFPARANTTLPALHTFLVLLNVRRPKPQLTAAKVAVPRYGMIAQWYLQQTAEWRQSLPDTDKLDPGIRLLYLIKAITVIATANLLCVWHCPKGLTDIISFIFTSNMNLEGQQLDYFKDKEIQVYKGYMTCYSHMIDLELDLSKIGIIHCSDNFFSNRGG